MSEGSYTHTVYCFSDKAKTKHFNGVGQAVIYANKLLADGEKCKIYPYRRKRSYTDYLIEQEIRDRGEE